jgi:hypothetical protein
VANEILAANPQAKLQVYAVWLPILRSDSAERWNAGIFADPRVVQYWDESDVVGRWFLQRVTKRTDEDIEWDAYVLYPAGATWNDVPRPLASWGRTVLSSRDELRDHLAPLLRR